MCIFLMVRRFLKNVMSRLGLQRAHMGLKQATEVAKRSLSTRHPGAEISYTIVKKDDFAIKLYKITFRKMNDTTVQIVGEVEL